MGAILTWGRFDCNSMNLPKAVKVEPNSTVEKRNIHVKCIPVNTSVFRCFWCVPVFPCTVILKHDLVNEILLR